MSPESRSADAALDRLLQGNARFAADRKLNHGHDTGRRSEIAAGQEPYAIVLGCADSRVPPELIFDTGLGELFVVRVAGNTAVDPVVVGSVEYAIEHLGTRLVVVLGHEGCGAVSAAVTAAADGASPEGAIGEVVAPIVPVIERIADEHPGLSPAELLARSVPANVESAVADLEVQSPAVAKRLAVGDVCVAGAVYRLESGEVELI